MKLFAVAAPLLMLPILPMCGAPDYVDGNPPPTPTPPAIYLQLECVPTCAIGTSAEVVVKNEIGWTIELSAYDYVLNLPEQSVQSQTPNQPPGFVCESYQSGIQAVVACFNPDGGVVRLDSGEEFSMGNTVLADFASISLELAQAHGPGGYLLVDSNNPTPTPTPESTPTPAATPGVDITVVAGP